MNFLKRKNVKRIIAINIGLFCIVMLWIVLHSNPGMVQLDPSVDFQDGWSMEADQASGLITFSHEISEEMPGKVICFYAYDSFVDAYADETLIYHYGTNSRFLRSPGSLWHMVSVPADAYGRTLSIRIQYVYGYKYTTDIEFSLGSSGSIILSRLGEEMLDLVINIILFVLGIMLCFFYFLELKNGIHNDQSLFLGLLCLSFVFWSSNSLFFFQLLFPYGVAQYYIYFFFLFLLPLLLMCYLETLAHNLKFNALYGCHLVLGAIIILLHLTGISEFAESISIFLVISSIELLIVILRLLTSRKHHLRRTLIIGFVILIAYILINIILFFINPARSATTALSKIGISFYLVISIYESMGIIITDLAEVKNSKMLKKIAFTDSLTGVGNRYAFNNEINGLRLEELSIFSFDINNLKYYNDTFGHACGDKLICNATSLLSDVFDRLYRTGGDEFIAVETNASAEKLAHLKHRLNQKMQAYNAKEPEIMVEIACGYSAYQHDDHTYEDMLRRADEAMYADKAEIKKNSKVTSQR